MSEKATTFEDLKITEMEIRENGMQSLRDHPNRGGTFGTDRMTAEDLKKRYDKLPSFVADKLNALIDFASAALGGDPEFVNTVRAEFDHVDSHVGELTLFLQDKIQEVADVAKGKTTVFLFNNSGWKGASEIYAHILAYGGYLPLRDPNGHIKVPETPSTEFDATSAKYVDGVKNDLKEMIEEAKTMGGTKVTVGGKEVKTFDADTKVGVDALDAALTKLKSEILNGSPEALDTLYELSRALGDDPNFATTIMEQIGKRIEKSEENLTAYGVDAEGNQVNFPVDAGASGGSIAARREDGTMSVADAVNDDDAVNLGQMRKEITDHAVPLGQLKTILNERIEEVETKVDRTSRRLSSISGALYETVVKSTSWFIFIEIPTTALPCIQVNRLSGYSERVSTGADVLSSQARTVDVNTSAVIAAMDGSTFVQTANLKTDYSHETFGVNVAPIDQFSAHTLSAEVMLVGDFSSVTPSKKMVVDGWCDASDYGMENYFPTASCTFGDELIEGGAYKTGVWIKCTGSIWIDTSGPTGGTCTGAYIGFADNIPDGCEVRIRNMRIVKEGEDDIVSINISKPSKLDVRSGSDEVIIDLPELISLPGWGFRLSDAVCNYYDFTSGEYVQMVGERAYKSGDESASQIITDGVTSLYALDSEIRSKVDIGFDGFIFITAGEGAYIYKHDASGTFVRGLIEVEYDTEV